MSDFQEVNGSIKSVSKVSFDIKRYAVLFQRLNLFLIGGVLLIPFIFYNFFDEEYINKRDLIFNYEDDILRQYQSIKKELNQLGTNMDPYESFYKEQLPRYYDDFAFIYGSMAITFLPWLYIFLWPVGTPVRVDRKRHLVYTWHWFRLYAARFDQLQVQLPTYVAALEESPGPLVIHLYRAGKTHKKDGSLRKGFKLRLGLYYPQSSLQNISIYNLMKRFLDEELDFPSSFKPQKGWLEYSLIPMRKFPNEKRLNKALDNWWDKEQYPRLCPAIEWMVHYVDELEREGKLLAKPVPIAKQSLVLGGQQSRLSGIIRDYP